MNEALSRLMREVSTDPKFVEVFKSVAGEKLSQVLSPSFNTSQRPSRYAKKPLLTENSFIPQ